MLDKNFKKNFKYLMNRLGVDNYTTSLVLSSYLKHMKQFELILNQEKNALALTYFEFFDNKGNINNRIVSDCIKKLIELKEPVLQIVVDQIGDLDPKEFDKIVKDLIFSSPENTFQWGMNYEHQATEISKKIINLFTMPSIKCGTTYQIQDYLNNNDPNFKYLSAPTRYDFCIDYVQKQVPEANLNNFLSFIDTFEKQLIDSIKDEIRPTKNNQKVYKETNMFEIKPTVYSTDDKINYNALFLNKEEFQSIMKENFKGIVGLENIKLEIEKIVSMHVFNPAETSINILLTGNPGTGKSTVAEIISKVLYESGVTQINKFSKYTAADLQGQYVGHTIPKIQKIFTENRGGVILLDEIYSLATNTAFTQDAVNELLLQLESKKNKGTIVIAAGYEDKITEFFRANPGLRSRFSKTIKLENYKLAELLEIAKINIIKNGFFIKDDAEELLERHLGVEMQNHDFGNARYVKKAVEEIAQNTALRIWGDKEVVPFIEIQDVQRFMDDRKKISTMDRKMGFK